MKTYGTISLSKDRKTWILDAAPHVVLRLKRLFPGVSRKTAGALRVSNTRDACVDLAWVLARWPMTFKHDRDRAELERIADEHARASDLLDELFRGGRPPRPFELAVPAREYQKIAADAWLTTRGLLLADDVGLGKTCAAIAALTDPATRPALVVTLAHLPRQWEAEIRKFAPSLATHVLTKSTPYDLRIGARKGGAEQALLPGLSEFPDVIISTYHKLAGWEEALAGRVRSVVFDECQELRSGPGKRDRPIKKNVAAARIAEAAEFRIGLSVGPDSTVELRGGPFGSGWVGPIELAWTMLTGFYTDGNGYDLADGSGTEARGWTGAGFGWKPVARFVRHRCDRTTRRINLSGSSLVATDDHSIFVVNDHGFSEKRAAQLKVGDLVPVDDGRDWCADGAEVPLDVPALFRDLDRAQVTVELIGRTRNEFGLSAWQWQNCLHEATYGSRLPVRTFLEHRHRLPRPTKVYVGRGKAAALPARLALSDWAYVLGFYLGDGWVSDLTRVCFAVENERVDDFVRRLRDLGIGLRPHVRRMRGRSSEVRCTHKLFALVLQCVFDGAKCHEKSLPGEWIVSWPRAARLELLRGLIDSDGHVSRRKGGPGYAYYSTTSRELARGVLSLLRSVGVRGGLNRRNPAPGGTVAGRPIVGKRASYMVHWSLAQMMGEAAGKLGNRKRFSGPFHESKVTDVAIVPSPEWVFDLEMTGHPSFVADGHLVHNSATPIYNYGGEFFNVLGVLRPAELGTKAEFAAQWCRGGYNDKAQIQDPAAFGSWLRDQGLMLRRTRQDVGRELPELVKIPHHIDCDRAPLDDVQDSATQLAKFIVERGAGAERTRGDVMQASEELSNLVRQATGVAKAPHVADFVRLLVENGEPVVLYGWHRSVYDIWTSRLRDLRPALYTGSESATQKQAAKEAFVSGATDVLIMSLRSGAGLDGLQHRGRTVVFGELDWSPGVHEQAAGRVHRDGQESSVVAYFLITDSGSDPIVADVLGVKRAQIAGVRDPAGSLVEKLETGTDRIRRLAEAYVERRA